MLSQMELIGNATQECISQFGRPKFGTGIALFKGIEHVTNFQPC